MYPDNCVPLRTQQAMPSETY